MTRIVPANKFIRKGVDEGEYAAAGTTENLRKLRRRVQGTAEKGLGAAGRTPTPPSPRGGGNRGAVGRARRPPGSGWRLQAGRRGPGEGGSGGGRQRRGGPRKEGARPGGRRRFIC